MKIRHHIPTQAIRAESVPAEYQAEVDRSTDKAVAAYRRAQRKLASAEERLVRAQARHERVRDVSRRRDSEREMAVAVELVELRREELLQVEALMKAVPASAEHRGTGGFRPVPMPGGTF